MFYTQHISLGTGHMSSVPTHSDRLGDGHQVGSWGLSDAFTCQGSPGCPPSRWSEGELKGQESREVGGEPGEQKVKRRRFQEGKGASIRCCHRPEAGENYDAQQPGGIKCTESGAGLETKQ